MLYGVPLSSRPISSLAAATDHSDLASRFPPFLRARVQACLTILWTLHVPLLQPCAPAALAAHVLHEQLGKRTRAFTYVDFCAGAGGATLVIERTLNTRLRASAIDFAASPSGTIRDADSTNGSDRDLAPKDGIDFVLTDIAPHPSAWAAAAKKSPHIHYIDASVDATAAPSDLLELSTLPRASKKRPVFRIFNLAFHHFDEQPARTLLANTIATSSGFAIFELVGRTPLALLTTVLMTPVLLLLTPFAFWGDWVHLFWTFVLPVIPFVVFFDGVMSAIRIRTGEEVRDMVESVRREMGEDKAGDWEVKWGTVWHTWPIGKMEWIVATRKDSAKI